jgi:hypothetical protein
MSRAKNTLTVDATRGLLKQHVETIKDGAYKHDDTLYIVAHYNAFLVALAERTDRVAKLAMKEAVQHAFEISSSNAETFAAGIARAFRYCQSKRVIDGSRTPKEVLAVKDALVRRELFVCSPTPAPSFASSRFDSPTKGTEGDLPSKKPKLSPGGIYKLYHCVSPTPAMRAQWSKVQGLESWEINVSASFPEPGGALSK